MEIREALLLYTYSPSLELLYCKREMQVMHTWQPLQWQIREILALPHGNAPDPPGNAPIFLGVTIF